MSVQALIAIIGRCMGRTLVGIEAPGGLLGFKHRVDLACQEAGGRLPGVGCVAWGGEGQRGRMMLQLTGVGCGLVADWPSLRELLEGLEARLTRVDLALDFLDGAHDVDEAVELYKAGRFNGAGRPPSSSLAGDWIDRRGGRTLYVGKAQYGKMLRVYEKGKQLGSKDDRWVRWEVQLGNRSRVIPLDTLTDPDAYLAGCYPAMQAMVEDAARAIPTARAIVEASALHSLQNMKRSYGKHVAAFLRLGATPMELVEEVRVEGFPSRRHPAFFTGDLRWSVLRGALHTT